MRPEKVVIGTPSGFCGGRPLLQGNMLSERPFSFVLSSLCPVVHPLIKARPLLAT
jgi:hypothetical protein